MQDIPVNKMLDTIVETQVDNWLGSEELTQALARMREEYKAIEEKEQNIMKINNDREFRQAIKKCDRVYFRGGISGIWIQSTKKQALTVVVKLPEYVDKWRDYKVSLNDINELEIVI